jgi:mono/diheme cytochrome c family protein
MGSMSGLKKILTGTFTVLLFISALLISAAAKNEPQEDTAAFYNSKCVACHGKNAEKKFDRSLTDDQMIEIVLKGKKPEKPPNMPAYGEKGVTAEQAKGLIEHMKALKPAP